MDKPFYRIHLEPEPEGGYTVTVPALTGCVTWGRDPKHAIEMAQEAISGYLESLIAAGESIPKPDVSANSPMDLAVEVEIPAA